MFCRVYSIAQCQRARRRFSRTRRAHLASLRSTPCNAQRLVPQIEQRIVQVVHFVFKVADTIICQQRQALSVSRSGGGGVRRLTPLGEHAQYVMRM